MFGSEILEVAIGLVLVYLLLALICSALSEWIARMFAMRSKTLKAGIRNLLDDPSAGSDLQGLQQAVDGGWNPDVKQQWEPVRD